MAENIIKEIDSLGYSGIEELFNFSKTGEGIIFIVVVLLVIVSLATSKKGRR